MGPLITGVNVIVTVTQFSSGSTPGVDEIHPEYFKAPDVVRLAWLTSLCNVNSIGNRYSHSGVVDWGWWFLFSRWGTRVCDRR